MPRRATPTWSRLGMLLVLAGLTAACATIPNTGPVQPGAAVLAEGEDPIIRVVARPPTPGMGPAEIVRGFLSASSSAEGDHAVAREYLTPKAAQTWHPDVRVLIYDQNLGITLREPTASRVMARARVMGRLDQRGAYTATPATTTVSTFLLGRVDGQWRIKSLPEGLLLTQLDIDRSYRAVSLYFLNATGSNLVPDPVYLPVVQPGLSTRLVQSLLHGPTPWLAPSVSTAFPAETQLLVDSVPVENGVAHVDLSASVLDASAVQREQLTAQLVWTLSELPDVNAVSITVQGQALPVGASSASQTTADWAAYTPDALPDDANAYVLAHAGLRQITDTKLVPVPGYVGTAGTTIADPAISVDEATVAVLSVNHRVAYLQRPGAPDSLTPVASGTDFAPPCFDSTGLLWLVDRQGSGSAISVVLPDGAVHAVRAPALIDQQVQTLAVSRDGSRVAVVIDRRGHGQLLLGRIERGVVGSDPNSPNSVTISGLHRIEFSLVNVEDVSWADAEHIALLARAPGAARQPYLVSVDGGPRQVSGALPGLNAIAAGPNLPLLGATRDGRAWRDAGVGWRLIGRGSAPAYPG
jgi:hypothetical protein